MRRTSLTLDLTVVSAALACLTLGACDLDDKSLGDTGADETVGGETEDTSDSDPSDSDPSGDPSGDPTTDPSGDPTTDPTTDPTGVNCTEIGCTDGFFLTLTSADAFVDGNYQLQILEDGDSVYSCDFGLQSGAIDDADCDVTSQGADMVRVTLPVTDADVSIAVLIDGVQAVSGEFGLAYEDIQPNGPGCEPICSQASAELAVPPPGSTDQTCEDLQVAFAAEFEAVRGCEEANECGQVIPGFSCGCTRDWVGRLDADPDALLELADDAQSLQCAWADWASTCDCPETDGFACIDNICQWSYVTGG